MRLWHKDLIEVLPRNQLLGQWRECCAIAKELSEKGFIGHGLVKKVADYTANHFCSYCLLVWMELEKRGYRANFNTFYKHMAADGPFSRLPQVLIFAGWHNQRYLEQCVLNLEEKYDCGLMTPDEWGKIFRFYNSPDKANDTARRLSSV